MDIPDRTVESVAFYWDTFRTIRYYPKPWWKFWDFSIRAEWSINDFVWHYAKELTYTPFTVTLVTHDMAQYKIAFRATQRLEEQHINSPALDVALVPLTQIKSWEARHRALVVYSYDQAKDLDNLILQHGQPQEQ